MNMNPYLYVEINEYIHMGKCVDVYEEINSIYNYGDLFVRPLVRCSDNECKNWRYRHRKLYNHRHLIYMYSLDLDVMLYSLLPGNCVDAK